MKSITVLEMKKFNQAKKPRGLECLQLFRSVSHIFKYNDALSNFLKDNQIKHV